MTKPITESNKPSTLHGKLVCRLRKKTEGRAARSPLAGEVELENVAAESLEIEVQMSPLQHLDLIVHDETGDVISDRHYGDRFSAVAEPYVFRLQPGEVFTANVSLLGNVPEARRKPGTYSIQAVYEVDGIRAESEPFRLEYLGEK